MKIAFYFLLGLLAFVFIRFLAFVIKDLRDNGR